MSYSLNSVVINPSSKSSPKNAVIICHGYGGDAKDISVVANYWKTFLTDTLFVCPNAPEICKVNPDVFQWFDLMDQTDDGILSIGSGGPFALSAAKALIKNTNLNAKEIAIESLNIAADVCIYTNHNIVIEEIKL